MFTKFTHFLQQAVSETFSPNLTLQEQFLNHWRAVTSYFVDGKGEHQRIEQTRIPDHLERMLLVLLEEEREMDAEPGVTGPCLEYLLHHKLLETLYTLGRTDHPPGMKQVVLGFFTRLLSRVQLPLLPHVNVYKVVQRMVRMCGEVKAAPTEKEEIEFLCTVCAKIKADPYLVSFFLEAPDKKMEIPQSVKIPTSVQGEKAGEREIDFGLVSALLSLSHSADGRVQIKACEGLMLCASLPEDHAAACLIQHTQFSMELASRLCRVYKTLPVICSPSDVETVEAKWGLDIMTDFEDQQPFNGKRQLISLLSWLDYCDQLINVANPTVAWDLAKVIRRCLLEGCVLPALLQASEMGAITATAYLTRCIRTVCSNALLTEFTYFLVGDRRLPEEPSNLEDHKLRHKLIERCNHLNEEMSVVTLKLFDTLLQKENEHIFHNLLLRNLLGRNYCQAVASNSQHSEAVSESSTSACSSAVGPSGDAEAAVVAPYEAVSVRNGDANCTADDETCKRTQNEDEVTENASEVMKVKDTIEVKDAAEVKVKATDDAVASSSVSRTLSTASGGSGDSFSFTPPSPHNRPEVHKIVNSFLTLVPEEGKSSYQTADSGYDMYLRDAHKQFNAVELVCLPWKWPAVPVELCEYQQDDFYPGSFLAMLLSKLAHMLDQSYTVNLLLTAVLARIALLPHPNIHEFILDPFLVLNDGVKTVYTTLKKVAGEMETYLKSDADFGVKLVTARKQLLGSATCLSRFEGQTQMEAVIVLEEFCKELSAIAFVKHHAAVTRM